MTVQIEEKDLYCHICGENTVWRFHVHLSGGVYISVPLCVNHRPQRTEITNVYREGLHGFDFSNEALDEIEYGSKIEHIDIDGPNDPTRIYRIITGDEKEHVNDWGS